MNLPNKLTLLRFALVPVFMVFMYIDNPYSYLIGLIVFAVASFTDFLDGNIARKYNMVTDFGKFMDPLADKMLTTAAFIGFVAKGVGFQSVWILFIVLFREFMVSSIRLIAVSSGGKVIAANIWGKAKTVSQMIAIIFTITVLCFMELFPQFTLLNTALAVAVNVALWVSTVLCVISGAIYLVQNGETINSSK